MMNLPRKALTLTEFVHIIKFLSRQAHLLEEHFHMMTTLQTTMKDMEFAQYRMAHEQRNTLHAMGAITQTLILQFEKMPFVNSSIIIPMIERVAASGNAEPLKELVKSVYDHSGYEGSNELLRKLSMLQSLVEVNKCIAEEYLDIKKIRSGNGQTNHNTFNIHTELENIINIVKMITTGNVSITLVGEPYEAVADSSRFHRCIMNILSNSVKACTKVQSPSIQVSHFNDHDSIQIVIVDNGGGIPDDILQRMNNNSNPFVHVCRDATSTGLGLPIVRHTIEEVLRGTFNITVRHSTTTVSIRIPKVITTVEAIDKPSITKEKKIILVVDDDDFILSVTQNLLESAGYIVYTACGLQAALQLFDSDVHFDVVFSDLYMPPGGDGIELAKQIRQIEALRMKTTVIFVGLSGTSCESTTHRWKCAGLDLFYTKPLSMKYIPEIMGFVPKEYPKDFPIEFKDIDKDVMNLPLAWTIGVKSKQIYKKIMNQVLLHPLIPIIISDDPKTPSANTLHHFLGIIAYIYAESCVRVGKELHKLLQSDQDDLDLRKVFKKEVKNLVKEINKIVKYQVLA